MRVVSFPESVCVSLQQFSYNCWNLSCISLIQFCFSFDDSVVSNCYIFFLSSLLRWKEIIYFDPLDWSLSLPFVVVRLLHRRTFIVQKLRIWICATCSLAISSVTDNISSVDVFFSTCSGFVLSCLMYISCEFWLHFDGTLIFYIPHLFL